MSPLLEALWRATWQGGLFVVGVFAITRVFRKMPVSARYWLWWLACLQFPVRMAAQVPILLPARPVPTVAVSRIEAPSQEPIAVAPTEDADVPNVDAPVSVAPAVTAPPAKPHTWPVAEIWMAGCVLAIGYGGLLVARSRRMVTAAVVIKDQRVTAIAEQLSEELRVRKPRIRLSAKAPCPMVLGWFRPVVLLPEGFLEEATDAQLTMALAHEMVHLKRHDLWLAFIPALTQAMFFFHPLSWLAARECGLACEEACDLEALRLANGSPAAYARLLIRFAQSSPSVAAMGAALGFRQLKRRIHMLRSATTHSRQLARRSAIALVALGVVCAVPWKVSAQTATSADSASKVVNVTTTQSADATSPGTVSISTTTIDPAKPARKPTKAQIAHHLRAMKKLAAQRKANKAAAYALSRGRVQSADVFATGGTASATQASSDVNLATSISSNAATAARAIRVGSTAAADGLTVNRKDPFGNAVVSDVQILDPVQKIYRVDFENVELTTAIAKLMKTAGRDFIIRSSVIHEELTCCVKTGTIEQILVALQSTANQNLTWRMEDSAFIFEPNQR